MSLQIVVSVKDLEPTTVAFLPKKGPFAQIPAAFGELYAWVGEKAYQPGGPPSGVYFNAPGEVPEEELAWELRAPLAGGVSPSDPDARGIGVKRVGAVRVASTMYRGPYEDMGPTYQALAAWVVQNGHQIAGPPEEVYFSDPNQVPPAEYLTEVRFPIGSG